MFEFSYFFWLAKVLWFTEMIMWNWLCENWEIITSTEPFRFLNIFKMCTTFYVLTTSTVSFTWNFNCICISVISISSRMSQSNFVFYQKFKKISLLKTKYFKIVKEEQQFSFPFICFECTIPLCIFLFF